MQVMTAPPTITPIRSIVHSHRTGTLRGLSLAEITHRLGFEPNEEDVWPTEYGWKFNVDGVPCVVWSYAGSAHFRWFSTWGPEPSLRAVFGEHVGP